MLFAVQLALNCIHTETNQHKHSLCVAIGKRCSKHCWLLLFRSFWLISKRSRICTSRLMVGPTLENGTLCTIEQPANQLTSRPANLQQQKQPQSNGEPNRLKVYACAALFALHLSFHRFKTRNKLCGAGNCDKYHA